MIVLTHCVSIRYPGNEVLYILEINIMAVNTLHIDCFSNAILFHIHFFHIRFVSSINLITLRHWYAALILRVLFGKIYFVDVHCDLLNRLLDISKRKPESLVSKRFLLPTSSVFLSAYRDALLTFKRFFYENIGLQSRWSESKYTRASTGTEFATLRALISLDSFGKISHLHRPCNFSMQFVSLPSKKYYHRFSILSPLQCFPHFPSLFVFHATRRWQAVPSKFFKCLRHQRVHRAHDYPRHFANALSHKWKTWRVTVRDRCSREFPKTENGRGISIASRAGKTFHRVSIPEALSLCACRIAASSNARTVVPVVSVGGSAPLYRLWGRFLAGTLAASFPSAFPVPRKPRAFTQLRSSRLRNYLQNGTFERPRSARRGLIIEPSPLPSTLRGLRN